MTLKTTRLCDVCDVGPRDPPLPTDAPFVPMASVLVGARHPSQYELRGDRGGVRARANDILFARIAPCLENGKVAQHPSQAAPTGGSTEFLILRPGPDVDPGYVYYWCLSPQVRRDAEANMTGTTGRMRLSGRDLAQFEISFPPLDKQRSIVDILEDHLSRLDAAHAYQEAAAQRLVALREATAKQALTGTLNSERSPSDLTDVGTADGKLDSLPNGWSWMRLGDVAEVVGGVTKDTKKQGDPAYIEVPYLRVANVQRGRLKLDDVTPIRVAPGKAIALQLEPGDVLLNEGGDRDKLARGWVWEGQIAQCIHQNHVFRARVTDPRLDPYFLSWTTNTFGGRWAERNGKQSVNLASISLSMIRKMPVIVPPPGEAKRVAAILQERQADFDRLETAIRDAKDRAVALRRAVLAAAFSGDLTESRSEIGEALESA